MNIIQTPDECFENLPGYPFEPHYAEIPDPEGGNHFLQEDIPDKFLDAFLPWLDATKMQRSQA